MTACGKRFPHLVGNAKSAQNFTRKFNMVTPTRIELVFSPWKHFSVLNQRPVTHLDGGYMPYDSKWLRRLWENTSLPTAIAEAGA